MTTRNINVDVAIIGAGSAGLTARRAAVAAGASVIMIDQGPLGTTCARVGCMPSKLLIAAADAAHHATEAARFGVQVGTIEIDGPAVMRRVRAERDRFVGFVLEVTDEARGEGEFIQGRARLTGPGRLIVDPDTEVTFRQLVIATGSSPIVPPPFRGVHSALLSNEDVFELPDLPASLLVVGLGIIGLELGQAFHRLGVRTTLIGRSGGLGPLTDPDVLDEAIRIFAQELDLHPDHTFDSIEPVEGGVRLRFTDSTGKVRDEVFERVLMAAGRKPNLDQLGLEMLGIAPEARGRYAIDPDTLQLGDAPVFVAGDVNGLHPLLHEAADDDRRAGDNAAGYPVMHAVPRRTPLTIVFSDPQIGIVGTGYRGLEDCDAVVGEVDYGNQGRARTQGINRGKVRIYADQHTGQLLGAELLGPRVEHLSHLLAWAVQQRLTVDEALEMPFYHPVVEEGIRTALRDLSKNLRHGDPIKCRVSELGVGS